VAHNDEILYFNQRKIFDFDTNIDQFEERIKLAPYLHIRPTVRFQGRSS
jgi:hypothetical protein